MKKLYEAPEVELVEIEDVILTSGEDDCLGEWDTPIL